MGLLRLLKRTMDQMPEHPVDGNVYYDILHNALVFDLDGERYRVNQPVDWEETDENSPAYIANRPNFGNVSTKNLATEIGQNDGIPTAELVYNAIMGLEDTFLGYDCRFSFIIDENGHLLETVDRITGDDPTFSLSEGRMIITYG